MKKKVRFDERKILNILLFILFTFMVVKFGASSSVLVALITELLLMLVGYFGLTAAVLLVESWKAIFGKIKEAKEKKELDKDKQTWINKLSEALKKLNEEPKPNGKN